MSSHKIPAVQRCPHCVFLVFSSFSTRLPETPVSIIGNIHLVSLKSQKLTHTIVIDLDIYPKSGNLLLGFPPLEGSLNSSVMKQYISVLGAMQEKALLFHTSQNRPCIPLESLILPLDSLFFALRVIPEGDCGDELCFWGDKEELSMLSTLSPCDGDRDGLLECSPLLLEPSLVSPGSSFCPFPG